MNDAIANATATAAAAPTTAYAGVSRHRPRVSRARGLLTNRRRSSSSPYSSSPNAAVSHVLGDEGRCATRARLNGELHLMVVMMMMVAVAGIHVEGARSDLRRGVRTQQLVIRLGLLMSSKHRRRRRQRS